MEKHSVHILDCQATTQQQNLTNVQEKNVEEMAVNQTGLRESNALRILETAASNEGSDAA